MRFEIIVMNDHEEVMKAQSDNSEAVFRMILSTRDMAEVFREDNSDDTKVFITDEEKDVTNVIVFAEDTVYCNGKDAGRFWDSIVDGWVY